MIHMHVPVAGIMHAVPDDCLASFEVGESDRVGGLELVSSSSARREQRDNRWVLRLEPSGDYYSEDVWSWRVTESAVRSRRSVVLEITFWDEGYGLIEAERLVDLYREVVAA